MYVYKYTHVANTSSKFVNNGSNDGNGFHILEMTISNTRLFGLCRLGTCVLSGLQPIDTCLALKEIVILAS